MERINNVIEDIIRDNILDEILKSTMTLHESVIDVRIKQTIIGLYERED